MTYTLAMAETGGGIEQHPLGPKLTAGARGSKGLEGAAIVLTRSPVGNRLQARLPLSVETEEVAEIDWVAARALVGLAADEQQVLALADSLATGQPVDLNEVLTGVDPATANAIVEAISHATDSAR